MQGVFSVYDMAAKRYLDPFFAPTMEFAIRGFREACETPGHQFGKFPEDYVLYQLGEFDPETGQISGVNPVKMVNAASFTKPMTHISEVQ